MLPTAATAPAVHSILWGT